jgi:hypothetical protein
MWVALTPTALAMCALPANGGVDRRRAMRPPRWRSTQRQQAAPRLAMTNLSLRRQTRRLPRSTFQNMTTVLLRMRQ